MDIAKKSIPVFKQPQQNKKNVKWWNSSCEIAVKERKRSLNTFKRHPSEVNRVIYKEAAQNSKFVILNSKQKDWAAFCESAIINPKNPKDFWNKIHRIKGISCRPVPILSKNNKDSITPRKSKYPGTALCSGFK